MKLAPFLLLFLLAAASTVAAESPKQAKERKAPAHIRRTEHSERVKQPVEAPAPVAASTDAGQQRAVATPRAQTLGRDQGGVYVNASAVNSGYSPSFVMRGFPAGLTLFDGASHGFTAQEVDLSTVDHVEFFKGPGSMLFGKALGGYGGAANYIRKAPTQETFSHITATSGAFGLNRITLDLNAPANEDKSVLFRMTGSAQTFGSFVNFVRTRSFNVAPMVAVTADNGDRATFRAEHNGSRLVFRDGVPADPIFFHITREFYAGLPANTTLADLVCGHRRAVSGNGDIAWAAAA